jgi:hypothetical protein
MCITKSLDSQMHIHVLMNRSQYLYTYYYGYKIRSNIREAIFTPITGALSRGSILPFP